QAGGRHPQAEGSGAGVLGFEPVQADASAAGAEGAEAAEAWLVEATRHRGAGADASVYRLLAARNGPRQPPADRRRRPLAAARAARLAQRRAVMLLRADAKFGLAGRAALVVAIEDGLSPKAAAAAFSVSPATAHRWW